MNKLARNSLICVFSFFLCLNIFVIYISNQMYYGVVTNNAYDKGIHYNDVIMLNKKQLNLNWAATLALTCEDAKVVKCTNNICLKPDMEKKTYQKAYSKLEQESEKFTLKLNKANNLNLNIKNSNIKDSNIKANKNCNIKIIISNNQILKRLPIQRQLFNLHNDYTNINYKNKILEAKVKFLRPDGFNLEEINLSQYKDYRIKIGNTDVDNIDAFNLDIYQDPEFTNDIYQNSEFTKNISLPHLGIWDVNVHITQDYYHLLQPYDSNMNQVINHNIYDNICINTLNQPRKKEQFFISQRFLISDIAL